MASDEGYLRIAMNFSGEIVTRTLKLINSSEVGGCRSGYCLQWSLHAHPAAQDLIGDEIRLTEDITYVYNNANQLVRAYLTGNADGVDGRGLVE